MRSRTVTSAYVIGIVLISMFFGMQTMFAEAKDGSFGGGDGSEENPLIIEDVWDLQNISHNLSANYALGNDIDASATRDWNSGAGFNPLGTSTRPFQMNLDGRNHVISGLFINRPSEDGVGLFRCCLPFSVKNLGLVDVNVTGNESVGALAGYLWRYWGWNALVSNIFVSGNVTGTADVGGLIGACNYVSLSNSHFLGNRSCVRGNRFAGGLIGVMGTAEVRSSHAAGTVAGYSGAGGLVGLISEGLVMTSYASGNVTGFEMVGGLAGYLEYGSISDSYALGSVTGTGSRIGGLVGWNRDGEISDSYAAGSVMGALETGGLVGNKTFRGSINDCFWDMQTSGEDQSTGGTGCTTAEMRKRSTFTDSGWDFDKVWSIVENVTYPFLRWQDTAPPIANAGPDLIVDEDCLVIFDGSGSRDDFGIFNYSWLVQNDAQFWLYGVRPLCWFLEPSQYIVTLTVTDAGGRSDTDVLVVDVNDITPPIAEAGPDLVVGVGTLVHLHGGASIDNVGIINYTWTFMDGDMVTIDGLSPTYRFDTPGTYVVTLNVTDSAGNWATDTMTVTVRDVTPPSADAGPDQTVDEGALVKFDGSGSSDNMEVVNWTWTFTDGALVTLDGPGPTYRFDMPGTFIITLNVTDAAGNWAMDDITVTVLDVTPPVAVAGPDLSADVGIPVTLDGSGSTDSGGIANYTWTFDDGAPQILYGVRPTYIFGDMGVFEVTLTVKDAAGHSSTDSVSVAVVDRTPPIAEAGPDITAEVGDPVLFDGSGCSDNVGIVNYTWECQHGEYVMTIRHSPNPYYHWPVQSFSVPFVYQVTLRVTDAAGLWSEDNMTLTLYDATPPVADAGPDLMVPVGENVILNGTLSTDNGMFKEYSWTFVYNGTVRTLDWIVVSFTFDMAGIYEATLRVTDLGDNSNEDSMTITVVDTGKVNGTVLDMDGKPVGGAEVKITASDGTTYSTTTVANGTFALDVLHGDFTWRISKEGYKAISGGSSVAPMDTTELDLADRPLVKKGEEWPASTSLLTYVALGAILVMVLTALVMVPRRKRGRKRSA